MGAPERLVRSPSDSRTMHPGSVRSKKGLSIHRSSVCRRTVMLKMSSKPASSRASSCSIKMLKILRYCSSLSIHPPVQRVPPHRHARNVLKTRLLQGILL